MSVIHTTRANDRQERGFTLVEILVVPLVLLVLAIAVTLSLRGSANRSATSACDADARTLTTSATAYMTQQGTNVLPSLGTSTDRFELFLSDAGFIEQVSTKYDLQADGTVTTTGQPCS